MPLPTISFDSVHAFLDFLPPCEREIVAQLREIIFTCLPDATEKLSYNVPFYYRHARICFIWPASVPWGGIKKGVLLGFCKGDLLSDVSELDAGTRKQVYTKTFFSTKEINRHLVDRLLYEAAWIDEENKKRKRVKK